MIEKWIQSLTFKKKLVFSFSLMIALTFIQGAALVHSIYSLKAKAEDYERLRAAQEIVNGSAQAFSKMRQAADGYLIGADSDRQRYEALETEMESNLRRLRRILIRPDEVQHERSLEMAFKTFLSQMEPILDLVSHKKRTEAILRMEEDAGSVLDGIGKKIDFLASAVKAQSEQAWDRAKDLAWHALLSSLVLFVSILLAGAGLSIGLYRSLAYPLAKLREGTERVAEGIWNIKMDVSDPPELKALGDSFENMAKSLTALQVHVMQLDRMSAVGTLAGGVAHEINNPLTGVLGQAQFVLEKLAADDPLRSNIEKIERAAQKCRQIVRSLLDFSRPSDFIFQALDVHPVIGQALGLCESEMTSRGIRILWEQSTRLPKVWASENHLEQVFINILMNALHAMPEGGVLTIRSQLVKPKGALSGQPWSEGIAADWNHIAVSFEDTGMGIEPQNLPHLFDPFFTTKEPGKGTGLGLSISYNIIKSHQGEITAQSEGAGKGSTFTVKIPVRKEETKVVVTAIPFESLEKKIQDFESRFEP